MKSSNVSGRRGQDGRLDKSSTSVRTIEIDTKKTRARTAYTARAMLLCRTAGAGRHLNPGKICTLPGFPTHGQYIYRGI